MDGRPWRGEDEKRWMMGKGGGWRMMEAKEGRIGEERECEEGR